MPDIRVVGGKDLLIGFQLAGVKEFVDVSSEKPGPVFKKILDQGREGIVITDDSTVEKLSRNLRFQIENSLTPVFVILSEGEAGREALRDMIRKSIGVDVMGA